MDTEEEKAKKEADAKKASEEADKALDARIAKTVNAAITGHMKRQPAGVSADDLEKLLDARDAKKAELDEEKRKAAAAGGSGAGGANNAPEMAKLNKELAELRKKYEATELKASEQEKKQQTADDKATITKTLEAAGVPAGQRARVALNHLLSEGLVKRTDDGLVFVGKDGEGDLADGITDFLKSEEGKLFLPPSEARGGGSDRNRGGGSGGKKQDARSRLVETLAKNRNSSDGG